MTKTNLEYPNGETFNYVKNTVSEIFLSTTLLPLILGIITQESSGVKTAKSSQDAYGLMQVTKGAETDVDLYLLGTLGPFVDKNRGNWKDNVYIGILYFKFQLDKYEDIKLALAAYNAGPGNVDSKCRNTTFNECKSLLPSETQNYVPAVLKHAEAWRIELEKTA